jgi:hypothetical protein
VQQHEATQQPQRFEAELHRVLEVGGGCMTLVVLGPKTSAALLRDVMADDLQAKGILAAADRTLRQIHRRSQARAMLCWLCGDSALWRGAAPHALGLLVPLNVLPIRTAIGLAFCERCVVDRGEDALGQAAVVKMREEVLPDLRLLPPMMQQAGHA